MRYRVPLLVLSTVAGLFGQAGVGSAGGGNRAALSVTQTAPKPAARGPVGPGWGGRRWVGGGWWGGGYWRDSVPARTSGEKKAEAKEDKLKELIISPVYEPAKVNPKMIEIP